MPPHPYIAALSAELARAGIRDYEVDTRRPHWRLSFMHNGQRRFVVFPASPSDSQRGVRNAVGFLRRTLGLAAPARGKSERPAKVRAERPLPSLRGALDARPDPMAVLAGWGK